MRPFLSLYDRARHFKFAELFANYRTLERQRDLMNYQRWAVFTIIQPGMNVPAVAPSTENGPWYGEFSCYGKLLKYLPASPPEIAARCSLGKKTVLSYLYYLRVLGLVRRTDKTVPNGNTGRGPRFSRIWERCR